jgi:hypothetical protein
VVHEHRLQLPTQPGHDRGRALHRLLGRGFLQPFERNLEATLGRISAQDERINAVEIKLSAALEQNTALTAEIHALTKVIHQTVCAGNGTGRS